MTGAYSPESLSEKRVFGMLNDGNSFLTFSPCPTKCHIRALRLADYASGHLLRVVELVRAALGLCRCIGASVQLAKRPRALRTAHVVIGCQGDT